MPAQKSRVDEVVTADVDDYEYEYYDEEDDEAAAADDAKSRNCTKESQKFDLKVLKKVGNEKVENVKSEDFNQNGP